MKKILLSLVFSLLFTSCGGRSSAPTGTVLVVPTNTVNISYLRQVSDYTSADMEEVMDARGYITVEVTFICPEGLPCQDLVEITSHHSFRIDTGKGPEPILDFYTTTNLTLLLFFDDFPCGDVIQVDLLYTQTESRILYICE